MVAPIRICVGAGPAQMLAVSVLEWSIVKHASRRVEVLPLCNAGITIPTPQDPRKRARTPFSFQRFIVPQAMGFEGRAVYLDSDMLVFDDIAELHDWPLRDVDGATVTPPPGWVPQFSVLALNCTSLRWRVSDMISALDQNLMSYDELVFQFRVPGKIGRDIPPAWNSLEVYDPRRTKLLHYTTMNRQPWLTSTNPLAHIWVDALLSAIADGWVSKDMVSNAAAQKHIRPSLWQQVKKGVAEPRALPDRVLAQDAEFLAHCKRNKYSL